MPNLKLLKLNMSDACYPLATAFKSRESGAFVGWRFNCNSRAIGAVSGNEIIKINLLLHAFPEIPVVTAKERNVISIAFRHRSVHGGHNCRGTTGQWSWRHVLTLLNIIIIIIYLMIIVYHLFIIYLFIIYLLFI